ncbi:unnamed protein product [Symbiodinium sp. CCMP2592]|nr:unnamed protein product [Symbiodinium sp. CCMP2592]
MAAPSCPSVPELREALAKAEAQHADNQEALQTAGHQGQDLLAEEQVLRQSLESCRQELEQAAEERSTPSERKPQARARHELERLQLRNQLMAEELEEHENVRSRSITTPRHRRGKSQSEDGRIQLQELNKELAEINTAAEEAARGWAQEQRMLASEVLEAEESEAKMLKQMREKLKQINERNDFLKEELRSEETKTQGKTLSLQTAVGQLRAELKCWSTNGGSPSHLSHFQNRGHGSSAGSEVWSGRASESSLGSGGSGGSDSQNSESQGVVPNQRKARRRPTSSFKPLEQMVARPTTEKPLRSDYNATDETEATSSASTALRSLRNSVSGLMDDALLRVGELLQDSSGTVKETKMEPIAETKFEQEDLSEGSEETSNGLWKGSHRESASAAFAHFGALLQQQVSSAAEMAGTAMPSRG